MHPPCVCHFFLPADAESRTHTSLAESKVIQISPQPPLVLGTLHRFGWGEGGAVTSLPAGTRAHAAHITQCFQQDRLLKSIRPSPCSQRVPSQDFSLCPNLHTHSYLAPSIFLSHLDLSGLPNMATRHHHNPTEH